MSLRDATAVCSHARSGMDQSQSRRGIECLLRRCHGDFVEGDEGCGAGLGFEGSFHHPPPRAWNRDAESE